MNVRPAKTQIRLGIHPVWSESSLCTQWVAKNPRFLHADSEDSDQTGRMPRLIWVFVEGTLILLVLSWGGSNCFTWISQKDESDLAQSQSCILTWWSFLLLLSFVVSNQEQHGRSAGRRQNLSQVVRKPVFGFFYQIRLKPVCSATATS